MAWVSAHGMTNPAPFPSTGQIAPKIYAPLRTLIVRLTRSGPRFAHLRVILFFCPIRASSWNQISMGGQPFWIRIPRTMSGKFF